MIDTSSFASGKELMRGAKARMAAKGKANLDSALVADCVVLTKHTQAAHVEPFDSLWTRDSKDEVAYVNAHRHATLDASSVLAESPLHAVWR